MLYSFAKLLFFKYWPLLSYLFYFWSDAKMKVSPTKMYKKFVSESLTPEDIKNKLTWICITLFNVSVVYKICFNWSLVKWFSSLSIAQILSLIFSYKVQHFDEDSDTKMNPIWFGLTIRSASF